MDHIKLFENFMDDALAFDWKKYDNTSFSGGACDEVCDELINYLKDQMDRDMPMDDFQPNTEGLADERRRIIKEWAKVMNNKLDALYAGAGSNLIASNFNREGDVCQSKELTFDKKDKLGRLLYKDADGNSYIDIDGVIHDIYDNGKPGKQTQCFNIKDGEPRYSDNK